MKHIKVFLLLTLLGCATVNAQDRYQIDGVISGNVEGRTVHLLSGGNEGGRKLVDSTIIRGGKFQFKGTVERPGPFAVKIYQTADRSNFKENLVWIGRPYVPLFLSNETIRIEAVLDSIPLTALKTFGYDFSKVHVTGSRVNAGYMEYIQKMMSLLNAKKTFEAPYKAYLAKRPNAPVSEGLSAIKQIDSIDFLIKDFVKKFVNKYQDNPISVYAFREAIMSSNEGMFTTAEIDDLLAVFSSAIKATQYFKSTAAIANETKKYAVGKKFTDLDLVDAGYKQVKLSDYVGKGKYVLLDFWGPWCAPCRKEFPYVKDTYKRYHPEGLEIIAISVDNHKDRWPKAMQEENLPYQNLAYPKHPFDFKNEDAVKAYAYWAIPFYLLIAPDGTIVDRNAHGSYLDKKLIEIYGNKLSVNGK
ncbi:TlpA disulfide reductase family protein [Pedobacter africanus]|uniref:Thiol-disulfide isomerase or thioredoxin n=1 Tax=Pedobacter africanus TaxID=151894 RepID=A0A1W1Z751_9SPHI|nr:TlpA disulfide reductase family protein [Pedobacter africanus]SMC44279.1 Thiol-disulfide isomerase or thioredoxin [Pedobacter africanus]